MTDTATHHAVPTADAIRRQIIAFFNLDTAQAALVDAIEDGPCFARKAVVALERGVIAYPSSVISH